MTSVAGLVLRTRRGEVLAGTSWLPAAARVCRGVAGRQGGKLHVGAMLTITIASRSAGESMLVPEPEELFSYPVVGTHEGGGHLLGQSPPQAQLLFTGWYEKGWGPNSGDCSIGGN